MIPIFRASISFSFWFKWSSNKRKLQWEIVDGRGKEPFWVICLIIGVILTNSSCMEFPYTTPCSLKLLFTRGLSWSVHFAQQKWCWTSVKSCILLWEPCYTLPWWVSILYSSIKNRWIWDWGTGHGTLSWLWYCFLHLCKVDSIFSFHKQRANILRLKLIKLYHFLALYFG